MRKNRLIKARNHNYKININNKKLENFGYLFCIDCFDMFIHIHEQDIIDTIFFNNDYKSDVVALPLTAYRLTMSLFEALLFTKELEQNSITYSYG